MNDNIMIPQLGSLVEIISINKQENFINLEVVGLKRFKINEFREALVDNETTIFIASGEIMKDLEIDSSNILKNILNKLYEIDHKHLQILSSNNSFSVMDHIERIYGKKPNFPTGTTQNSSISVSQLEPLSFYYLNIIKNEEKKRFYISNNLIERVDW
jgi:hypothetical protein